MIVALACVPGATAPVEPDLPDDTAVADDAGADDDARVRALGGLPEGDSPAAPPLLVRVEFAVDGDTFWSTPDEGGADVKVRMIGIDTPEIAHEDPAECWADEAWTETASIEGRLVWLTYDADPFDDYDRTLAYVFRDATEDGFWNRRLARRGFATEMSIAPNTSYAAEIAADIDAARAEDAGLWGNCR